MTTLLMTGALAAEIGGYARFFGGRAETYETNAATKIQPHLTLAYKANDDVTLYGKTSFRLIYDLQFPEHNRFIGYQNYISVKSQSYGKIDFGYLENVAYLLHKGVRDVGLLDIENSDIYFFFPAPAGFYAPTLTHIFTDRRNLKANYTTPEIYGITTGITTVLERGEKTPIGPGVRYEHGQGIVAAIAYENEFDFAKLAASIGYGYYRNDRLFFPEQASADHSEISTGISISKYGYSVGASYRHIFLPDNLGLKNTRVYSTGVSYEQDPYGISLTYLQSSTEWVVKDTRRHLMLSGSYQFNKYLRTALSTGYMKFSSSDGVIDRGGLFIIAGVEFLL
ncbi:MAG: porin [Proteobacteria bacterium]|nr:porin [Pseudomonadota bacterium]